MLPPPSLSSIPSDDQLEDRAEHREIGPMVPITMTYDDEFAPSSATLSVNDPAHVENKGGRLLMYNRHLLGEGKNIGELERVMLEAEQLGCLHFPPPFPPFFIETSEAYCHQAIGSCGRIAEDYEEHSEEWLILNCYLNAVIATEYASKGATGGVVGESMFLLGAALRELELVRRNKRDALRGKTTLRAASKGGEMQNAQVSQQTLDLVAYMAAKIESGASVSDAARWAFQAKLGSSVKANRAVWYRSRRKL